LFFIKGVLLRGGGGSITAADQATASTLPQQNRITSSRSLTVNLLAFGGKTTTKHNYEQQRCSYGPFQSAEHRILELKKTIQSLDSQPPYPLTEHANSQYHPEMLTNELLCLVCQQNTQCHIPQWNDEHSQIVEKRKNRSTKTTQTQHSFKVNAFINKKIKT